MVLSNSRTRLQERCVKSTRKVLKLLEAQRIQGEGTEQFAWGHFLDPPSSLPGVYATSTAIQLLSLDKSEHSHLIHGGEQWLTAELEKNSQASKKGTWKITYKICAVLNALAELGRSNKYGELANELVEHLLDVPEAGRGWGEFFHTNEKTHGVPTNLSTSLALLALVRHFPFSTGDKCVLVIKSLKDKVIESTNKYKNGEMEKGPRNLRDPTELALCLLVRAR